MSAVAEQIGRLADHVDNLVSALRLPMPPQFHVEQLRSALSEVRDTLRLIYIAQTGDDPWETHPDATHRVSPETIRKSGGI